MADLGTVGVTQEVQPAHRATFLPIVLIPPNLGVRNDSDLGPNMPTPGGTLYFTLALAGLRNEGRLGPQPVYDVFVIAAGGRAGFIVL